MEGTITKVDVQDDERTLERDLSSHRREMEKENLVPSENSPLSKVMNKSYSSPTTRRKSGSPLAFLRNFASLSNRGSPSRPKSNKGSPFTTFFGKVRKFQKNPISIVTPRRFYTSLTKVYFYVHS